jgi:hypothetical protein
MFTETLSTVSSSLIDWHALINDHLPLAAGEARTILKNGSVIDGFLNPFFVSIDGFLEIFYRSAF